MKRGQLRLIGALVGAWAVVAVPVAGLVFAQSSETTAVAGHEAVVSPAFDGYATLDLGPYLPNLRYPSGRALGAHIDLGKTNLTSYEALISRYATIGAQPEGEIAKHGDAASGIEPVTASGMLIGRRCCSCCTFSARRWRVYVISNEPVGYRSYSGYWASRAPPWAH